MEKGKDWWENNQESIKDGLALVVAILVMMILSPLLIIAIITMLIMAIEIDIARLKRIFKLKELNKKTNQRK
ncbi:hypothetical protein MUP35_03500 [Patescibacteria group bacterium]|nr:hypothetical protein [Patescibacteria group bacterium]